MRVPFWFWVVAFALSAAILERVDLHPVVIIRTCSITSMSTTTARSNWQVRALDDQPLLVIEGTKTHLKAGTQLRDEESEKRPLTAAKEDPSPSPPPEDLGEVMNLKTRFTEHVENREILPNLRRLTQGTDCQIQGARERRVQISKCGRRDDFRNRVRLHVETARNSSKSLC